MLNNKTYRPSKNFSIWFTIIFPLLFAGILNANTINIPTDYTTIQAGINATVDGDTILVQPGTYVENMNFNGKNIVVGSLYLTTQDTSYISQTIIDGNHSGSVVTFNSGEDSTSILIGFAITNGRASSGGGINCLDYSSPYLSNLIIMGNTAYGVGGGGGIHCYHSSSPTLYNLVIKENISEQSNSTTSGGGGISLRWDCSPYIVNTCINNNTSNMDGGGIFIWHSSLASIINSTICNNTANGSGGGIYINYYCHPVILNTIISNNSGNGIYLYASSTINITYSCFWNNPLYNCGEWVGVNVTTNANGESCDTYYNMQLNPLFVDPANGDYHLTKNSPCIDAGDPGLIPDPDNTIEDIGAYYFHRDIINSGTIEGTVTLNGVRGSIEDVIIVANGFITNPDSDGYYSFEISQGTYDVTASLESYHSQTIENVEVIVGQTTSDINFALEPNTIWGYAYLENQTNHNGIKVFFERTEPCILIDSTYTDSNGYYFIDIETGIYNITFSKTGYLNEWIYNHILFSNTTLSDITLLEHTTILNVPSVFSSIQSAINYAFDGDTVFVQPGTYVENINYNGKNITVASLFLTTQDTSYISQTIIDGNQNGSVVTFNSGEDSTSILIGFTITNGRASSGGGINCLDYSSSYLSNLIIMGNTAYGGGGGGGIHCYHNSSPTLYDLVIKDNTSEYTFSASGGGGISLEWGCSPNIVNTCIGNNTSNSHGGGIYIWHSSLASIINSTICNNTANGSGGGIYINYYCHPVILNTIISNNSGNGIYLYASSTINITYSCFWNNPLYNCNYGEGCIEVDPLFSDSQYHLSSTSPCIDAGDPNSPLDPDGTIADMGAYYYHQIYSGPVWHVSTSGDDSNSGRSTSPFATIQQGIDAASDGDTVLVYPGTYFENINYNGKNIVIASLFLFTSDDSYITQTVINGNQSGSVVRFMNSENSDAQLIGLTLMNGTGTEFYYEGAMIYLTCGGGIFISNGSSPEISNCIIKNNSVQYNGGGIHSYYGGMATIKNSIIMNNSAMEGGAVSCTSSVALKLLNCTIYGNSSEESYGTLGGNLNIINSIIWNSTIRDWFSGSISYSDIEGSWEGEGNIDTCPIFVDTSNSDFHLQDISPCIGTGIDSIQIDGTWYYAPTTDIDGNPRPNPAGSRPDIGAYENSRATPIDTIPPAIPQNLVITDYLQAISLKWNASVNADLSHYNIYRANFPDFSIDSIYFKGKVFAPDTTYIDSLIQNNNTYYYQITAVDTTGNESDPSDELVITAIVVDIRDITFQQRVDGSGLVNIYYSFSGNDTTHYEVIPYLSNFNDEAWGKLTQVSGDAGAVLPGDSRQITWNLKSEAPKIYSNNSTIKITIGLPSKGNQYNPLNEAKIQIDERIER